jgi:ornithine cyclodeaminase|tara:strand:- start:1719 stop:2708 length:990 start_codon:yes stop_codon:yes gene_type:complete
LKVLIVNKNEIKDAITMLGCIELMEDLFVKLEEGIADNPLRKAMVLPNKNGGLLSMMPGYNSQKNIMGIKTVSVYPENADIGLESHQGTVTLFDSTNGIPLAIMDASQITSIRTAAVSAVATKALANKNSKVLAIIGSGVQAASHIEAMNTILDLDEIRVWSRNKKNVEIFIKNQRKKYSIPFIHAHSISDALENADVVCTTTSSNEPLIFSNHLTRGMHINAVGSSVKNAREFDGNAMKLSKLYVDKIESTLNESGDFLLAKKEGIINDKHIKGTIGEVLINNINGRESKNDITLFKSLGLAIEDISTAFYIYEKYKKNNEGHWIEFC